MQGSSQAESVSCTAPGLSRPAGRRGARARRAPLAQAVSDGFESCARVARDTHLPSRRGLLAFFGNEVLVNAVAGTSALVAGALARRFLEIRGLRNLWGLAASKTAVSADDYQTVLVATSYAAGLLMLILVRQLILRVAGEFHALRRERARDGATAGAASARGRRGRPDPGSRERDPGDPRLRFRRQGSPTGSLGQAGR